MNIGERIKYFRKEKNLTRKQLGMLVGYSGGSAEVTISRWERGDRIPKTEKLKKLACALDVSVSSLLDGECACIEIPFDTKADLNYEAEYNRLKEANADLVQDNAFLYNETQRLERQVEILEKQLEIVKLIFGGTQHERRNQE